MPLEYAHGYLSPPAPLTIALTSGGNFSAGAIAYLWWCAENATGYTLLSDPVTITYLSNQAIQCTLPAGARTAATGFYFYHLGFSFVNDPALVYRVGRWRSYNNDGTDKSFSPITLSRSLHIEDPSIGVATPNDLPTGSDRLPGTTRLVVSKSAYYLYDPDETRTADGTEIIADASGGKWVITGGTPLLDIPNPYGEGGCAQPAYSSVPSYVYKQIYKLNEDGGGIDLPASLLVPVKLYYRAEEEISAGTPLDILPYLNGQPSPELFDKLLLIEFGGYVNLETGTLDVSDSDSTTGEMDGVGQEVAWEWQGWPLYFPKTMPVGFAYLLKIKAFFAADRVAGLILPGSILSIDAQPTPLVGTRSPLWNHTGNAVDGSVADYLRVLPDLGSSAKIAKGQILAIAGYTYPRQTERTISAGLTPGNYYAITLDGHGHYFVRAATSGFALIDALPASEGIRAFVGLLAGTAEVYWTEPIAIAANKGVRVTVEYPWDAILEKGIIRDSYPTIGGMRSPFNPPYLKIWIKLGGTTYEFPSLFPVLPGESQVFSISSLASATISSPPAPPRSDFCLFDPPTATLAEIAGTIAAGTYQVGVAYYFVGNTISVISHDTDLGCMPEMILNLTSGGGTSEDDIEDLILENILTYRKRK